MLKKSLRHVLLVAAFTTSFASYATQYPLTISDIAGQKVTIKQEPKRIVLQDGRDIMALALLDRNNPFTRVVAWNNLPKKTGHGHLGIVERKMAAIQCHPGYGI